jgi:hypothetical protein
MCILIYVLYILYSMKLLLCDNIINCICLKATRLEFSLSKNYTSLKFWIPSFQILGPPLDGTPHAWISRMVSSTYSYFLDPLRASSCSTCTKLNPDGTRRNISACGGVARTWIQQLCCMAVPKQVADAGPAVCGCICQHLAFNTHRWGCGRSTELLECHVSDAIVDGKMYPRDDRDQ